MTASTITSFDAGDLTTAKTNIDSLLTSYKTTNQFVMWREGKRIHVAIIQ